MNDYCWNLYKEPYIAHHGILGQKWGAKNGPPYPLGSAEHNKIVSKASPAESSAAKLRGNGSIASYETANSKSHLSDQGKRYVNSVIRKGTILSRTQINDEYEKRGAIYVSYKWHDVNLYVGLFGQKLKGRAVHQAKTTGDKKQIEEAKNMKVYQVKLKSGKDIKVASDKAASKVTGNLLKNEEFKSNLSTSIDNASKNMWRPGQKQLLSKAQYLLKKDPDSLSNSEKDTIYKALNLTLTFHNSSDIAVQNAFYKAMRDEGFGAIIDVNDKTYSSYRSQKPLIVFDTSKIGVSDIKELFSKDVMPRYVLFTIEKTVKDMMDQPVTALPNVLSATYYSTLTKYADDYNGENE